MPKAIVQFEQLVQDSQDFGSDGEHMVSRIFFSLELDGTTYRNLYADVKQTVGSSFETGPLEISKPVGYRGPWDHQKFATAAEGYYRGLVGNSGSGIKISGEGSNIRMRNNRFGKSVHVEFEVKASGGPW